MFSLLHELHACKHTCTLISQWFSRVSNATRPAQTMLQSSLKYHTRVDRIIALHVMSQDTQKHFSNHYFTTSIIIIYPISVEVAHKA